MYSIYHFWKHIVHNKASFSRVGNLAQFKFDADMLSCENIGIFPDLAIKLNKLVRGQKKGKQKICLVHGSFFETISTKDLISQSFGQVLDEKLAGTNLSDELKEQLRAIFSEQEDFSRVRNVNKASVKLRYRILTEVKPEENILDSKQYPEILDDSINFLVPYYSEKEQADVLEKMEIVMGKDAMSKFHIFSLKHPLNGWFVVFQAKL